MSANWQKAKEIFAAAVDIDAAERPAFLKARCGEDADLLAELRSLLSADEDAFGFMDAGAISEVADIITAAPTLETGRQFGHYEIISLIGTGGMGQVYLAVDTRLDRKVALKLLPFDPGRPQLKPRRFEQEARVVSLLNHPNILTIYDFGTIENENFIVAEFVDGETLRKKISEGRLTVGETLQIVIQVASALCAAHKAGIVHRDIKPENVMVRPDGVVKILDFGIAKLVHGATAQLSAYADPAKRTMTRPGMILGTLNYMSPEQARGKDVDERSDIFSLGSVLYEMLCGRVPFDSDNSIDTIALILYKEPLALDESLPGVSPELEALVGKMLAKERNDRYRSADELLNDLTLVREDLREHPERKNVTSRSAFKTDDLIAGTTVGDANRPNISSAEYVVTELKTHKRSLAAAGVLLLVASLAIGYWQIKDRIATGGSVKSIAVLPFVNASVGADQDYLADGLTETLIADLTKLPDLSVTARNSVFRYKGNQTDPKTIGSELGVQAVLNGTVTIVGDNLTLSLELVDTRTGNGVWSAKYDRRASDLVTLQAEIARDVSKKLKPSLSGADGKKIEQAYTANNEAYQHYLKGRFFWNKRTGPDLKRAITEFEQAVNFDSSFALAYVGLADSYALVEQYLGTPSTETLPKAKGYAARALEIDDSLAEAHTSMGFILYTMWDWEASDKEFKRAIELNPNYSTAHHWYYILLRDTGRLNEALEQIKLAKELDPLSLVINVSNARAHLLIGDTETGIELDSELIELYPTYAPNHTTLGLAYIKQGRKDEGLAEMKKAAELDASTRSLSLLAYANAVSDKRSDAISILKELEPAYDRHEILGRDIAAVYVGLGEYDKAFQWLEKDFANRSSELAAITAMQEFDPIRGDPRYTDLMKRMGLTP